MADGAASGGISRAQWSRESAGSLGRRAGLLSLYHRDRNRRAAGRCRSGRCGIEQDDSRLSAKTADAWNASIERWLYCSGTELAHQHGVDGYYVRVAVPDRADAASPCHGFVPIKNRPPDQAVGPAALMVSLDALALVRFGLRAADDPRIVNTVKVVDATLKVDTPRGPVWHRYQGDELRRACGRRAIRRKRRRSRLAANRRARTLRARGRAGRGRKAAFTPWRHWPVRAVSFRSRCGIAPTSLIADCSSDIRPARPCRSSGRMPSTSSCADHFKMERSSIDRLRPFSVPSLKGDVTSCHLALQQQGSRDDAWQNASRRDARPSLGALELRRLADCAGCQTRDTTLGVHVADLETLCLNIGDRVDFTLYWPEAQRWEGADFVVCVEQASANSTMAGQFLAISALDRVRDAVEDQIRPCVEQDQMASQEPILDVLRQPR